MILVFCQSPVVRPACVTLWLLAGTRSGQEECWQVEGMEPIVLRFRGGCMGMTVLLVCAEDFGLCGLFDEDLLVNLEERESHKSTLTALHVKPASA